MPWLFLYAFMLGLVFNAAPGAILAESLRRGLKGGFMPAMAVQIGSLVGDGLWVMLGLAGAAALISISYIKIPLMLSGAILLGYLAWQSFRDSRMPMPDLNATASVKQSRGAMATGVALSVSNPLNITYWAALGGTIAAVIGETPRFSHYLVFIAGFMFSSVLWCFIASGMIAWTRARLTPRLWRLLHLGCGLGLILLLGFVLRHLAADLTGGNMLTG
ncbi:LysE family transporter [Alphaproteobacteria bacterium LSUCC0684]